VTRPFALIRKKAVGFDQVTVLGKRGEYGRGLPKDRSDNVTSKRGNSRSYILARLDCDGFAELLPYV